MLLSLKFVRHIALYSVLLVASILIQTSLPDELRRFAPFCMAIPSSARRSLRMAGHVLATLVEAVSRADSCPRWNVQTRKYRFTLISFCSNHHWHIAGSCGSKAKRSRFKLRSELSRNQNLSRQLITAERSVRRDIARELHGEIGRNITAIRTQANIIKRVDAAENECSLCGHDWVIMLWMLPNDTTKRLLTKLRPKMLDDLDLKDSVGVAHTGNGVFRSRRWYPAKLAR